MDKYIVPNVNLSGFTCPNCGVLAGMDWNKIFIEKGSSYYFSNGSYSQLVLRISTCKACGDFHLWLNDQMLIPRSSNIPMPNDDMPEKVKEVYLEAREVFLYSPKSSAALLRLAVQILCKELGEEGSNINKDIASLVDKGLPVKIQQALDAIRVIGNNAVHPGTIDLDDNKEMAALLFEFINVIVHDMITQPNSINALYSQLPQGTLDAIQRRDGYNS